MEKGLAIDQAAAGKAGFLPPRVGRQLELKAAGHRGAHSGCRYDQRRDDQKEQIAANVFRFACSIDQGYRDGKDHQPTVHVVQLIWRALVEEKEQDGPDDALDERHRCRDPERAAIDGTDVFALAAKEEQPQPPKEADGSSDQQKEKHGDVEMYEKLHKASLESVKCQMCSALSKRIMCWRCNYSARRAFDARALQTRAFKR